MKKTRGLLILCTSVLLVAGCSASSSSHKDAAGGAAQKPAAPEASQNMSAAQTADSSNKTLGTTAQQAEARKVITTVNLTLQVGEVDSVVSKVTDLIEGAGGYVAKMDKSHNDAHITLRIPTASASSIMDAIKKLGEIRNEQVSGQDVTEDYFDTDIRIKALQVEEGRLLELVKQAGKLEDILKIETELARVRTDIERGQGHIRLLDNKIDFTTVELSLSRNPSEPIDAEKGAWTRAWKGLTDNVHSVWVFFREAFVWLMSHLLTLLILVIIGYGVYWLYKRDRKKNMPTSPVKESKPEPEKASSEPIDKDKE